MPVGTVCKEIKSVFSRCVDSVELHLFARLNLR